jgi:hypothetical protein
MADEPKPKARKKVKEPEPEDNALVAAAKTIGTAAGKIASLGGVEPSPPRSPAKPKPQKLQKKNKSRLPRRQKKALRKGLAKPVA